MDQQTDSQIVLEHQLFIIDAELVEVLDQSQMETITRDLIDELMKELDMEPLGPLEIYPAVDLRAPGWSFIQPITTSHISGHYFEAPGTPNIHMDIYSCKSFSWIKIIDKLHNHLRLSQWEGNYILRERRQRQNCAWEIIGNGPSILSEILLKH